MKKQKTNKMILGVMVIGMLVSVAGCKKTTTCDFCEEKKPCTEKETLMGTVNVCDDCMAEIEE